MRIREAIDRSIRERVADFICFLVILGTMLLLVYNVFDLLGDQPRLYRGLTDHCRETRLADLQRSNP